MLVIVLVLVEGIEMRSWKCLGLLTFQPEGVDHLFSRTMASPTNPLPHGSRANSPIGYCRLPRGWLVEDAILDSDAAIEVKEEGKRRGKEVHFPSLSRMNWTITPEGETETTLPQIHRYTVLEFY